MCNCIKEIQDSLRELPTKFEEWHDREITNVSIENACFMLSNPAIRLYSPVKVEYDYLNKKGEKKHKKEKVNFNYQFCPFCGEKYKED